MLGRDMVNKTTQIYQHGAYYLGNNSDINKQLNKATKRPFKELVGIKNRFKGIRKN